MKKLRLPTWQGILLKMGSMRGAVIITHWSFQNRLGSNLRGWFELVWFITTRRTKLTGWLNHCVPCQPHTNIARTIKKISHPYE